MPKNEIQITQVPSKYELFFRNVRNRNEMINAVYPGSIWWFCPLFMICFYQLFPIETTEKNIINLIIAKISTETEVPGAPFITPTKYFGSVYSVHRTD